MGLISIIYTWFKNYFLDQQKFGSVGSTHSNLLLEKGCLRV